MPHLTLLVLEVSQQKSGLITGLMTDLIISPNPKQFEVKDWSYLNSLYMHESNTTRGSFDPVLSSLAGLFISYLQRATQNWTWGQSPCHAPSGLPAGYPRETTKYTSSQTQRTGEKRFKEKMLAEKEHKRMTCSRTYHLLLEWNALWEKVGHSAAEGCRAQNYSCEKQIPFCHLPTSEHLTSQPRRYFNTALLLGQLTSRLRREVDSTVTTSTGTICRTQQHFWTCSGTLPVDLP